MFANLLLELENLCPFNHDLFTSNVAAFSFLKRAGVIQEQIFCPNCSTLLVINNFSYFKDGFGYRCSNRGCRKIISPKFNSSLSSISVEFKKILRAMYAFTFNFHQYQAVNFCDLSHVTVALGPGKRPELR